MFGVALDPVTSAAEIETVLEEDPQDPHDMEALKNAHGYVKTLGVQQIRVAGFVTVCPDSGLFERTKINRSIPEGRGMTLWAYNAGAASIGTATLTFNLIHYGVWLRD